MRKKLVIISSIAAIVFLVNACSKSQYLVGIGKASINPPDTTVFSVAIGGYGYPPQGRFSIEWIKKDSLPSKITAITGWKGKLYAAGKDQILRQGKFLKNETLWKNIGKANEIIALAAMSDKLYAVTVKGELLVRKINQKQEDWRKIGVANNINSLTALNGALYATNKKNELLKMIPSQQDHNKWSVIGTAKNRIISMASHKKRLLAVNSGDTLYHILPFKNGIPWTEIGRNNGITYNIPIKQLVVLNNRLFAVSGNNKLYEGRHSENGKLLATTLAIKKNSKTVLLIGLDIVGMDYSLSQSIKKLITKKWNIPSSAIIINVAHDHFAPIPQSFPAWKSFYNHPDSLWLKILKKRTLQSVGLALNNMSSANLFFGRGKTNIGLNRSAANPNVPVDHTLDVLVAKANKHIKAILFSAASHAVFKNAGKEGYTLSSNFPGVARKLIHKKTGANAVFIQGCAGDINPRSMDYHKTGNELANDVLKVLNGGLTKITGNISYAFDSLRIPIKPWSIKKVKQFKGENSKKPNDVEARKNVRWANVMLRRYQKGTVAKYLPEYIQFINIGNWKLVGLSREAVNEYGPAIRKIWPDKMVTVAGYSNDVSSYLPKEWHVVTRTYEGYGSFFWYGQSGIPPVNVFNIVINDIKRLGKKNYKE
jgi:hypothetical protein